MGLGFVFEAFNLHFLEQLRILWPFLTFGILLNLGAGLALARLNGNWRLPVRFSIVTADSWMVFVGLLVLLPFTDSSFGRVKPVAVVFAIIFRANTGSGSDWCGRITMVAKELTAGQKATRIAVELRRFASAGYRHPFLCFLDRTVLD